MTTLPPLSHRHSRSVAPTGLQPGDVIVSTTHSRISRMIRAVTGSPVSHSMIYVGNGRVIEAVKTGVVERSLQTALADATLAVVYRHADVDTIYALTVLSDALSHSGAGYDYTGAAVSASPAVCGTLGADDRFFCSELVVHAFNEAPLALTGKSPECSTPQDIVQACALGNTDYVGHMVADGSLEHDFSVITPEDTSVPPSGDCHEGNTTQLPQPVSDPPPNTEVTPGQDTPQGLVNPGLPTDAGAECPIGSNGVFDPSDPAQDPYDPGGSHG